MSIVTQFQLLQQVADTVLLEYPLGLAFSAPAMLAESAPLYLALEPSPAAVRFAHSVASGQVSLLPLADGSVRVTVQFDRGLIAAMVSEDNRGCSLNLYRLGWSLPVLQIASATWTQRFARLLGLFATSKARIGGNHWGIDAVFLVGQTLHLYGWAIAPSVREPGVPGITVNGVAAEVQTMSAWPRELYWLLAQDRLQGFHAIATVQAGSAVVKVELAYAADGPQMTVRFPLYQYLVEGSPDLASLPDLPAIHRVSGPGANHMSFINSGRSDYERFLLLIRKHHHLDQGVKVLDWGVGCGRIALHFARDGHDVHGIDIDSENVRWCNEHIADGKFQTVDLYPPTSLQSNSFDVIISSSVLSHLTEATMRAWLAEISRLLAPGGRALLSYNGDGTSFLWAGTSVEAVESLVERGIFDGWRTADLDGAVRDAETYYRLTLFRSDYVHKIFSEYFTVHAVELGVTSGSQDIVVLQKKA